MGTAVAHAFGEGFSLSIAGNVSGVSADRTGEYQLAYEGVWLGHHSGKPITLTAALFNKWTTLFKSRGRKVVVDYEHQTLNAAENGKPNPASGRLLGLSVRQGINEGRKVAQLWGRIKWTPRAADYIKAEEIDGLSIVFHPMRERESGEDIGLDLTSVALTNTPFIPGMEPVQLSLQGVGLMAEPIEEEKKEPAALADDAPPPDAPTDEPAEMADPAALSPLAAVCADMAKTSGKSEEELAAAFAANMDKIMALIGTQVEAVAASASAPNADFVALSAQVAAQNAKIEKLETQLKIVSGLKPAVALSSVPNEKRDPTAIDTSTLNPVQLSHFNNLAKTREPAVALKLVTSNPRLAR